MSLNDFNSETDTLYVIEVEHKGSYIASYEWSTARVLERTNNITQAMRFNLPTALNIARELGILLVEPLTVLGESLDYTDAQTFKPGDRVELHPGCDLWMRGAKFGTVVGLSVNVCKRWAHLLATENDWYLVKLDAKPYTVQLPADRLRHAR